MGVKVFDFIATRLKFSNPVKDAVSYCIKQHMNFSRLVDMKPSKASKICLDPNFDYLVTVAFCDDQSRSVPKSRFDAQAFADCLAVYDHFVNEYQNKTVFDDKVKEFVTGDMVIKLRPELKGEEIGECLNHVKSTITDKSFDVTKQNVIDMIKHYIKIEV